MTPLKVISRNEITQSGSLAPAWEPQPSRRSGVKGRWSGPNGIPTPERGNEMWVGSLLEIAQGLDPQRRGLEIATAGFFQHQIGNPQGPGLSRLPPPFACPHLPRRNDKIPARTRGKIKRRPRFLHQQWGSPVTDLWL